MTEGVLAKFAGVSIPSPKIDESKLSNEGASVKFQMLKSHENASL